jgi:hypothetical protein
MQKMRFMLFVLALSVLALQGAMAQRSARLIVLTAATTSALDGVFAGFKTKQLVGLGDAHGLAQEQEFYAAILRDPRFARDVGNIVVEFGGASQQAVIDRYVNGEDVPYIQLRKVWSEVVGWVPTVTYQGFINLYATIRSVNSQLPPAGRIKVWLGEPPIDWKTVTTSHEWMRYNKQRDIHAAALIERQILARNKKALIIYGTWHLGRSPENLRSMVEKTHPGAFFIVTPYTGYYEDSCSLRLEKDLGGTVPKFIIPVRGTSLETRIRQPGCHPIDPAELSGTTPAELAKAMGEYLESNFGLAGDALLYLGPKASLVRSPTSPDLYLDQDYRKEIDRRYRLMMKHPLDVNTVERNPVLNQPYLP